MVKKHQTYEPSMHVEDAVNLWEEDRLVVPSSCADKLRAAIDRLINDKAQKRANCTEKLKNQTETNDETAIQKLEIERALADARITECQRLLDGMPVVDDSEL